MYSVKVQNQKPIKKAKGVKTSIVQNTITFEDYIKSLRENVIITRQQQNIRSRRHNIHTEKERKIALSAHDDKRCLQPGTTDTLPWGHYRAGVVVEERANQDEADEEWGNASRRIPQNYPYITRWCASRSSFEQSTL